MKNRRAFCAPRGLALALTLAVGGCAVGDTASEAVGRAESALSVGNMCASPVGGGDYCVPATQGAEAAWNQAASHGAVPIQMWATRPADVTLDQLVGSAPKLTAWLADVDAVLGYVKNTKKSAESYRASLAGTMGTLLREAQDRQDEILRGGATSQPTPIEDFKRALTDKANAAKGPLVAELATKKQKIGEVRAIVDRTKNDVAAQQGAYNTLVSQFKAYRATEPAATAQITALAQQASQTTLATMPSVEQQLVAFGRQESTAPGDLIMAATRLAAAFRAYGAQLTASLEPYQGFMQESGATAPDMTSSAVSSLANMIAYCEGRRARADEAVMRLVDGLVTRRQALVSLAADEATRGTIAQTQLLNASTIFLDDANSRISNLWRTPPTSTTLRLPYLAQRYEQFTTFLQLEPLCAGTDTSWRESGCVALRRHFTTAHTYQERTIPTLIRAAVVQLRARGVPAAPLDEALSKLATRDVKAAAMAYDAALRLSEGR